MPLQHWIPEVLRAAGLTVREHPGWRDRDRPGAAFRPRGVMWHHDASKPGDSPNVPAIMARDGADGAQLWVDRYGTWTVIAAGLMWHAGRGAGRGRIRGGQGNVDAIGIETDHTIGEPWPAKQHLSLRRGTAALLRHLGADPATSLVGHKEYAPGRKPDPDGLDMEIERRIVAALMASDNLEDDMAPPSLTAITWPAGQSGPESRRLVMLADLVTSAAAGNGYLHVGAGWVDDDADVQVRVVAVDGENPDRYLLDETKKLLNNKREWWHLPSGVEQVAVEILSSAPGVAVGATLEVVAQEEQ